jgi:5-methylcytosine-specific restriction endonuclease McrA
VRTFQPGVGRELPTTRVQAESPDARLARLERGRFYASVRWRRLAAWFLAKHPICEFAAAGCQPCDQLATVVDHRVPRLVRPDLAYDADNLRSACAACHARHGDKS